MEDFEETELPNPSLRRARRHFTDKQIALILDAIADGDSEHLWLSNLRDSLNAGRLPAEIFTTVQFGRDKENQYGTYLEVAPVSTTEFDIIYSEGGGTAGGGSSFRVTLQADHSVDVKPLPGHFLM